MIPQIAVTLEHFWTLAALIRPNSIVSFLMCRKCTWPRKSLFTYFTWKGPFTRSGIFGVTRGANPVNGHTVRGEFRRTTKHFATSFTFARLLSCMDSFMVSMIVSTSKCSVAILTDIRCFTGVKQLVLLKMWALSECLSTLNTLVWPPVIMYVHMSWISRFVGEMFATFHTVVRQIFFLLWLLGICNINKGSCCSCY